MFSKYLSFISRFLQADSSSVRRSHGVAKRSAFRPTVEHLEDRTLLSTAAGPEFLVNTTTAGVQATTIFPHNYLPIDNLNAVASDAQGNFVAVWSGNGPGDADGIFAQRYDSAGNALGSETLLNSTTSGAQTCPVIARASSAGLYAAAWDSGSGVYARVFNADGTAATGQITVAAASSNKSYLVASIAMDASGDFVILYKQWVQKGFTSTPSWVVQRYNASGQAQGTAKTVATPNLLNGRGSVGMDANGNFVVAWDEAWNGAFIYAQRYNATGKAVGSRITVNPDPSDGLVQWQSNVAMGAAGNFVVTWAIRRTTGSQEYAQIFNANGTPRGSAFTFGSTSENPPASIAVEGNGDFVLTWQTGEISAQRFDANGVAKEAAILVNTTVSGDQSWPSVAVDGAGDFVVVWNNPVQANGQLLDCDVYGQRFTVSSAPAAAATSRSAAPTVSSRTAFHAALNAALSDDAVLRALGRHSHTRRLHRHG